jgi:hypothetical protein
LCPLCGGPMVVIQRLTPEQIFWEALKQSKHVDTS